MVINSMHPIKLSRIAVRSILQHNKPGVVCLIASDAGLYPWFTSPLYVATKHAVVGFGRSLAQLDAQEGVKVVVFCPG